jgi:hypothetical protein
MFNVFCFKDLWDLWIVFEPANVFLLFCPSIIKAISPSLWLSLTYNHIYRNKWSTLTQTVLERPVDGPVHSLYWLEIQDAHYSMT